MTARILFAFNIPARVRTHFEDQLGKEVELLFPEETDEDTLLQLIPEATVVVGGRATELLLQAADNLVLWQGTGVGVSHHVDVFRDFPEVTLTNSHGNTYLVAQHAVTLLLSLAHRVWLHHNWMAAGRWRTGDDDAVTIPLHRRTVGFLGYGYIGRHAAQLLSGFDVSIRAFKRAPSPDDKLVPGVKCHYSSRGDCLLEFLEQVQFLIMALPETTHTRGIIGTKELAALGEDGLIVNVGRGSAIEEQALYDALSEERIGGAALDVWWREREPVEYGDKLRPYNLPFHELSNVLMSPHRAASPRDALLRWDDVIENIRRAVSGRRDFLNTVDLQREY